MSLQTASLMLRTIAVPVTVVDIGAMDVGNDEPPAALIRSGKARVIGFEPVQDSCAKLNAAAAGTPHRLLPHAVGDGTTRTFHRCRYPMTSSLYEPDAELLAKFQTLGELTVVEARKPIETRRLDDISEIAGAELLKMDVQGAELDVLRGGTRFLESVLAVQTEISFVPLYQGQALFADVDAELRRRGFAFHKFLGLSGRAFKPFVIDGDPARAVGQTLWGDAVYMRDFMRLSALAPEQLVSLAFIANEAYGSFDLAATALQEVDRKTGEGIGAAFVAAVLAAPAGGG